MNIIYYTINYIIDLLIQKSLVYHNILIVRSFICKKCPNMPA